MTLSKSRLTRRAVLTRSFQAGAAMAVLSPLHPLLAAPASRWFKIGACDWSLGKRCDPAAFDLAKQIGLDGIQVDMGNLGQAAGLRSPELQKKYLDAQKASGLGIASIAFCIMNSVPLKGDPRAAQWLLDGIDAAKALEVGIVMPAMFGNGDLDMKRTEEIDQLVKVLKKAAAKAEKQEIIIALENYLSAEDNMRIIDRVASPAVKVYYDVGNSTDKHRDIYKEIRELGKKKLLCEFHAKDAGFMLGQGRIDFQAVRKAMDDVEFSGWIHIEAAHPHGLIPDYTADCKFLKGIFPAKA